jgi:hypothetical protein
MAPQPELDRILKQILDEAVRKLVEFTGEYDPRALFLSGSARWGEFVAASMPGDRWHPLSDLDLFLIAERRTARLQSRVQEDMHRWFWSRFPETFTRCPLTVGTYSVSDLPLQHPTLGIAELRRANLCLWGEADLLQRFPDPEREGIEPWELIRLLLNRSLEFVEAWGRAVSESVDDASRLDREYAMAKLGADLATVLLAREGRLAWGYANRAALLAGGQGEGRMTRGMAGPVEIWTHLRSNPSVPGSERMADWEDLRPLDDLLPWLRRTWCSLLDSWDVPDGALSPRTLQWERGGVRNRVSMLRRSLRTPPEGHGALETVRLWWASRPAKSFRTALGWGALKFLMLLQPEGAERAAWRGETARRLSPWITGDQGDPHLIAGRYSDWVSWIGRVETL